MLKLFKYSFFVIVLSCKTNNSYESLYSIDSVLQSYEAEYFEKEGNPRMDYLSDETFVDYETFNSTLNKNYFKKFFSEDDIISIRKDIELIKPIKITNSKINSKILISNEKINNIKKTSIDGFWMNYLDEFENSGFYRISSPMFSLDKNKFFVVLETNYLKFNSNGFVLIFKKQNKKWVLKKSILCWY